MGELRAVSGGEGYVGKNWGLKRRIKEIMKIVKLIGNVDTLSDKSACNGDYTYAK